MNNEAERAAARLQESTQSLWSFLSEAENLHPLTNPLYTEPLHAILKPSCKPQNMQVWVNLYARYFFSWEAKSKLQSSLLSLREEGAVLGIALEVAKDLAASEEERAAEAESQYKDLLSDLQNLYPTAEKEWNELNTNLH